MEAIEDPTNCKKRFKGVENFLRRVAFNLGNTPSQTEVKIISCIPIDVTDLQQKIIQLEKQLEDARPSKGKDTGKDVRKDTGKDLGNDTTRANPKDSCCHDCTNPTSEVHTTLFSSHFPRFTCANICKAIECNQSNQGIQCNNSSNKRNKSTVSLVLSNSPSNRAVNMSSEKTVLTSEKRSQTMLNEFRKKFIKKKKYKKQKVETQLVYYAKTDNVLYNSNTSINNAQHIHAPYKGLEAIDRPYLSNVVKKQYKAGPVVDELSDNSLFSSPICRDVDPTWQKSHPYESDICSCCHENFHNVDNYITQANQFAGLNFNTSPYKNAYYDSSLYDLVPVKEKPVRNRKEWRDFDFPKRKENKIDMKCWREPTKTKTRCSSVIVNYHTVTPAKNIYAKKYVVKTAKRDSDPRLIITQDKRILKVNQQTAMESSKSCCVDLGEFYPKAVQRNKPIILAETTKPPLKNAECFTDAVAKVDCQTTTTKIDEKTEMTLNQIKNILQSVLTEVKTNTQPKNNNNNAKKDAIIQKGASQSNILEGSNFLNSFTYSPYNINPYGPSCSKHVPSNYFCHPVVPQSMRCMQNYPLIIQTPGRQMCTSCYRSSQYKSYVKNATTATNTKEQEERGKVTEKLIQEIYKSVALGLSGKNTSVSECDDLKSAKTTSNKSKEVSSNETKIMISEIFKNNDMQVNTSDTHDTNTTIFYRNRKDMSARSRSVTTEPSVDHSINTKKDEISTQQSTETEPEVEKTKYPRRVVKTTKRIETISESTDTETSSTESDTDVTTISIKKPEKKKSGLISKVFNLFNRKKKAKVEIEVQSESSDSDYQTIYSQKINPPKRTEHRTPRSRPHSKLHSRRAQQSQRSPERPKRTPYMEQEYRRLWNEKLSFQNTRPRYSSERPATWETSQGMRQRPVYYQNYEARSVLVDPRQYQPRYDVINGKPCLAEVNNLRRPLVQPNNQNFRRVEQSRVPTQPGLNTVIRNATHSVAPRNVGNTNRTIRTGVSWLKNEKLRRCGEQWKKILIES